MFFICRPSLSYQRIQKDKVLSEEELLEKIRKTVCNPHEMMVFESFMSFNRHILKTNFYQGTKVALSFRLDPAFLPVEEYPQLPFGMFLVVGGEFRGFHVRFRDVARGGIRIIRSRNREAYSINLRTLFDENYALASTQQRKNKDIPEGGSKGTILLDASAQDKAQIAFEKYVDAILDLLLSDVPMPSHCAKFCDSNGLECGATEPSSGRIVDRFGQREILFFGPDEGTAEFMDWASLHARKRGAPFWKAFTTGKSQSLGGIPHDLFGMTTRSIHQYTTGIYRKLGLKEEECHKFQTGGPDGDLGSNEIKISRDCTIAIVDGSGVIYDPQGLDRTELMHLAQKRQMICNFVTDKLSPGGFRVLIDERDVVLPNGEIVDDGLKFRNEFHLHPLSSADLFVPCGGRPEAVDINNVHLLFTSEKTGDQEVLVPRFKYIVEGANLFFTQEARIRLEAAGVMIFKDASANKGGVTSSSLEVLAALAFTDEEFSKHMQVASGIVPEFYQEYIRSLHAVIERNAELEFECLWREHQRQPEKARSVLSDELSFAIVKLNEELQNSETLYMNVPLRHLVLSEALPRLLQERLGLETLINRLPENYIKASFGSFLASRFIYKYGTNPSQFAFFEYMSGYFEKLRN
jgi:glutamate dehydrogenase